MAERVGTRVLVALAVALILSGARATGALGATLTPGACNASIPASTNVSCFFDTDNGEWITFQVKLAGTTNTAHLVVSLYVVEQDGTTRNPSTNLLPVASAYSATAGAPAACGTALCYTRAFQTYGADKYELRLSNTDIGGAHTATTTIYTPSAAVEATIAEPLDVAVVSGGYPDTQTVAGTIACSNCAGGGGSGGEVQIDPTQNTVQLSSADRDRLDLGWWGTWAVVGLMFALMLAPRWFNAFRVTQGG